MRVGTVVVMRTEAEPTKFSVPVRSAFSPLVSENVSSEGGMSVPAATSPNETSACAFVSALTESASLPVAPQSRLSSRSENVF